MSRTGATPRTEFGPRALAGLARLAAAHLEQRAIDPEPLLARAGLSRAGIAAPRARITVRSQIEFVNLAAEALGDELLGFHLAREGDLRELGAFYYVMASAPTLGEALAREERYSWSVNEGIRTSCRRGRELEVDVAYVDVERLIGRQEIEFWIACTVRKARMFTGRELKPTYVGFVHRRVGDIAELERYLGVTPTFSAPRDGISFEAAAADLPQITADAHLQRLLVAHLEEAAAKRERRPERLRVRVENAIVGRLPHGAASAAAVAADLGMSTRTLSRRLADEGESFGAILDTLRSELAQRYLQGGELSMSQIAWLLGYGEASSFARAVQRWTGKSPGEIRRASTAKGTSRRSRA